MKKIIIPLLVALAIIGISVWAVVNYPGDKTPFGSADDKRAVDLIGIGYVASTTDGIANGSTAAMGASTIFSFASSSNMVYWDTIFNDSPHRYGATTTGIVYVGDAEQVNMNFYYDPISAVSQLNLEFYYSPDSACDNSSSTLNVANWYPLPVEATSSPSHYLGINKTVVSGYTAAQKFGLVFKDINYNCLKVVAYNNSTTDPSLLYATAKLKELK